MVEGKYGISARVLCDSISEAGVRLLTFEIQYPRIILAEFNTHRMLSKNSASSRAIPFAKMQEQLIGRPVRFGQANSGMQDKGEDYKTTIYAGEYDNGDERYVSPEQAWELAKGDARLWSERFHVAGYHKQVYNRLTEPFQMMKTVVSATEWANFFWLRDDGAADPTIAELARVMRIAKDTSVPTLLKAGEWHLPYVESEILPEAGCRMYFIRDDEGNVQLLTLNEAINVSAARSAAVSFRNVDYGLEKSQQVHERLVGDERKHGSAMEHQATPMKPEDWDNFVNIPKYTGSWEDGISHMDREENLWSGNFRGWRQYRKLIPGENVTEY